MTRDVAGRRGLNRGVETNTRTTFYVSPAGLIWDEKSGNDLGRSWETETKVGRKYFLLRVERNGFPDTTTEGK